MPMNLGTVRLLLFPPTNTCYFRNRLTRAILGSLSGPDYHLCFARVSCFLAVLIKALLLMEGQGGRKGNVGD